MTHPRKSVLILGGSFGGLEVLRQLRARRGPDALGITVVDRQQTIPYVPLAHEAACGGTVSQLSLASACERFGARFVQADVRRFDPDTRTVVVSGGEQERRLCADVVIVALGSRLGPPQGFDGAAHLLTHKASSCLGAARRAVAALHDRQRSSAVVVGGSFSGIELAAELAHRTPAAVTLLTGRRGLTPDRPRAANGAAAHLARLGVVVETAQAIAAAPGAIVLDDGRECAADAAFWMGGLQPSPVLASLNLATTDRGFLRASPMLTLGAPGVIGVLGVGDAVVIEEDGRLLAPMHGRVLEPFWQAPIAAHNALALLDDRPLERYRPRASFPHGFSMGDTCLLTDHGPAYDLGRFGVWGRRQLGAWWWRRYAPHAPLSLSTGARAASEVSS